MSRVTIINDPAKDGPIQHFGSNKGASKVIIHGKDGSHARLSSFHIHEDSVEVEIGPGVTMKAPSPGGQRTPQQEGIPSRDVILPGARNATVRLHAGSAKVPVAQVQRTASGDRVLQGAPGSTVVLRGEQSDMKPVAEVRAAAEKHEAELDSAAIDTTAEIHVEDIGGSDAKNIEDQAEGK